jgi:glucosamine--fructose-6-phosphate aminotransferase (isomerizing)
MAIMEHTKKVIYLDDYDVAVIKGDKAVIRNLKDDKRPAPKAELLDYDNGQALLGDFPNFMLKEIFEAPATIRSATLGRSLPDKNLVKLGGLESVLGQLKYIDRIVIVACGTSYYAGLVGEYLIEELADIPVEVQSASEFKYRDEPFSRSTALLAISQSGETADTIAALKKVENYGVLRLGIVNAVGSTIARMTDAGVYCHAGPEKAVASTKAFIAQVTVLAQIALHLSNGSTKRFKPLVEELNALPAKAQAILDQADDIKKIAEKYADYRDILFIGRNYAYPMAMEGALKLKEISYMHAEGYPAGEMKHGPLAMIDKDFPTFVIATDSPLLEKTYSNIQEIRARKGPVVAIATDGNDDIKKLCDDVIYIPKTLLETQPILQAVAVQLFAYYIAMARGYDVDHPRNLAKSVTVE